MRKLEAKRQLSAGRRLMHGLVSLGMLEKPHLIHSSGEGADQESPHTIYS